MYKYKEELEEWRVQELAAPENFMNFCPRMEFLKKMTAEEKITQLPIRHKQYVIVY